MPYTGREVGLRQDAFIDERLDPEKATEGACLYLKKLYNIFGDWELALAAYNCGPGNVRKAMRHSGKRTFWSIYNYLPRETRSYVPQFVAAMYAVDYASEHNIFADSLVGFNQVDTIYIDSTTIDVVKLAQAIEADPEEFIFLNPELTKNIVPGYLVNYPLKVPGGLAEVIAENQEEVMAYASSGTSVTYRRVSQRPSKVYHRVRRGEYLGVIARKYNVSVSSIRAWNNLRNNNIAVGQRLVIHRRGSRNYHAPTYYTVKQGDTLDSISDRYNLPKDGLMKRNRLDSEELTPGQRIAVEL